MKEIVEWNGVEWSRVIEVVKLLMELNTLLSRTDS